MTLYIGISYGYHDSAVAAIDDDGEIVYAGHEERYSRIKHDERFPSNALRSCLSHAKNNCTDIVIGYYENAVKKEARKLKDKVYYFEKNHPEYSLQHIQDEIRKTITSGIENNIFNLHELFKSEIHKVSPKSNLLNLYTFDHHESHASGAFHTSPFTKANILTMDGAGEYETCSIWHGDRNDNTLKKLWSSNLPFSLGLFYSTITSILGFRVNEGEYKVMGLSAYGSDTYLPTIEKLIGFHNGEVFIDEDCFNFGPYAERLYTNDLLKLLGVYPAQNTNWVKEISEDCGPTSEQSKIFCDIAKSAQTHLKNIQLKLVDYAESLGGMYPLCTAGGVALNSLANRSIDHKLQGNFFVFPPSGDAGSALGAAYQAFRKHTNLSIPEKSSFNPFNG